MIKKNSIPIVIPSSSLFGITNNKLQEEIKEAIRFGNAKKVALLFIQKELAISQTANDVFNTLAMSASLEIIEKITPEELLPIIHLTNTDGDSPLIIAIRENNINIAHFLIKSGADINQKNNTHETPLITACWQDRYDIVSLLLKSGAEPNNIDSSNQTAISYAMKIGNEKIVALLLEYGANIDIQKKSFTPQTTPFLDPFKISSSIDKQKILDK